MLFSSKSKGFFVEKSAHTVLLARTSSANAPMVVEEVRECAADDAEALAAAMTKARAVAETAPGSACGFGAPARAWRRSDHHSLPR